MSRSFPSTAIRWIATAALLATLEPSLAQAQADASAPDANASGTAAPATATPGATASGSLPQIVISATRLPTPVEDVGSSVTVITADDIAKKQERTLPDVLSDVPGLNVVQTGGAGEQTSVFIRGTDSNHTKVLIDGIDVSDPSSPNGAFNFANVLTDDIERVEVLRGPQSGLYGSDAIGGVINIVTKKGSGPAQFTGSVEGGSFGTFNQSAGVSGSVERFSYAVSAQHYHSDDTPVTPLSLLPPGQLRLDDDYDNKTFATKLGANITDTLDVGLVARYIWSSLLFTGDQDQGPGPDASQSKADTRQLFTRATVHQVLFDGRFDQTLGIGFTDDDSRSISPGSSWTISDGNRVKLDWQGNLTLTQGQILTLGAEHQVDAITDSPISAQMTNDAGFVQLQSSLGERLFNAISLRYDDNDRFGGKTTYRIAPAFLIPETDTRLKASLGTGFKAPTLNELFVSVPAYDFFANPNLKPEESTGYDVGFEQGLWQKAVQFGATYFHNDITNLINYNADFTSLVNVDKAVTYGVESFAAWKPLDRLSLRADYTYTIAEDAVLHTELLRRPRNKVTGSATWQVTDAAAVTATVLYVGPWADVNREAGSPAPGGSYTVFNLAGSYDLGNGITAFARIDNLLDRTYQDPVGFQRPGLGVFGGFKVSFGGPVTGS